MSREKKKKKKGHSPCPHGAYGQNKEEAFNSARSYTVRTEKGGVYDALRMWDSRRASLRSRLCVGSPCCSLELGKDTERLHKLQEAQLETSTYM